MKDFKNYFAEFRIRLARGAGLFYDVKNALMVAVGMKILFDITLGMTVFLTISVMLGFYMVGYLDLRYFKTLQEENRLNTSKYNPHLNKLKVLSKAKKLLAKTKSL